MRELREEERTYQVVRARQGELYEGLYDAGQRSRVGLLAADYEGDDLTARRFAFLEID